MKNVWNRDSFIFELVAYTWFNWWVEEPLEVFNSSIYFRNEHFHQEARSLFDKTPLLSNNFGLLGKSVDSVKYSKSAANRLLLVKPFTIFVQIFIFKDVNRHFFRGNWQFSQKMQLAKSFCTPLLLSDSFVLLFFATINRLFTCENALISQQLTGKSRSFSKNLLSLDSKHYKQSFYSFIKNSSRLMNAH